MQILAQVTSSAIVIGLVALLSLKCSANEGRRNTNEEKRGEEKREKKLLLK